MKIYKLLLFGSGFTLKMEGDQFKAGFYKNEYVLARNETIAVRVGIDRVLKKLKNSSGVVFTPHAERIIRVEEIDSTYDLLYLLRNDGFIYFPIDDESSIKEQDGE
jgi:hypothetical protein